MPATESRSAVGLLDIVGQLPGVLVDAPQIVRAVSTGMFARPTSKTSIGKVFQERAEKYADRVFLRFGDQQITYAQANATANRYASVLADRGVGRGDVVGIMLRNSPNAVLMMLATVKCGAVAGMLNYHQRGDVLAHSIGLLKATTIVAEPSAASPPVSITEPSILAERRSLARRSARDFLSLIRLSNSRLTSPRGLLPSARSASSRSRSLS